MWSSVVDVTEGGFGSEGRESVFWGRSSFGDCPHAIGLQKLKVRGISNARGAVNRQQKGNGIENRQGLGWRYRLDVRVVYRRASSGRCNDYNRKNRNARVLIAMLANGEEITE